MLICNEWCASLFRQSQVSIDICKSQYIDDMQYLLSLVKYLDK